MSRTTLPINVLLGAAEWVVKFLDLNETPNIQNIKKKYGELVLHYLYVWGVFLCFPLFSNSVRP